MDAMNNFQALRLSVGYIGKSRVAWFYILISCARFFVPSTTLAGKNLSLSFILSCVGLLFAVVPIVFLVGFIHSIFQKYFHHRDVSIRETWDRGESFTGKMLGFYFLVAILLLFLFGVHQAVFHTPPAPPLTAIFGIVFTPITSFCMCAIVIDQVKVLKSIPTGFRIVDNHLSRSLGLGGIFFLLQNILLGLLMLIIFIAVPPRISFPLGFDLSTYQNLLQVPIISLANQVLAAIIGPWNVTAFTMLYLDFTKEFPPDKTR
ncbi:MAG: hypothetical protein WA821_17145 [Anaerolineales bacterium]